MAALVAAVLPAAAAGATGGSIVPVAGRADDEWTGSLAGSLTTMGSAGTGVQVEGLLEEVGDSDFAGAGGHLFRTSGDGRLLGGLMAGVATDAGPGVRDVDLLALGVEGQAHPVPDLRLAGQLGMVDSDPGDADGFGVVDARWFAAGWSAAGGARDVGDAELRYLEGGLRVDRGRFDTWIYGGRTRGDEDTFYGGLEWEPTRGRARWRAFVELADGDGGYEHVLAGIRLDLGDPVRGPALSIFDPITAGSEGLLPAAGARARGTAVDEIRAAGAGR